MSHQNSFSLTGPFKVIKAGVVRRGEIPMIEVLATIQTGPETHGGLHRVRLYGREAKIASAFVEASGGNGLEATVWGSVFSGSDGIELYASRLTFHTPRQINDKALGILKGSGAWSKRGTGPLSAG